ncbi:MAG: RelA/SpoT family protein [Patescibacteria group bacterium]
MDWDWENFEKEIKAGYLPEDLILIKKAFEKIKEVYQDDRRLTGEPCLSHLTKVAGKSARLKLDAQTIAASLLHDAIEDKKMELSEIKKEFGENIAFLVKSVTEIDEVKYHGVEETTEAIRKMFLAMAKDIRVVFIKFIDRLENLKTLDVFPLEKRRRKALETLEIYSPVANRLGMGEMKAELEDAAFKYVWPEEYQFIIQETQKRMPECQKYLEKIKPLIQKELEKEKIKVVDIHSREKHYYSLWKKLKSREMDWEQITDLAALRIVVENIEDCYRALGALHKLWKPLPGKIKDYIALPKPNGYQSLHTTVFCEEGKITEFQIRTSEMHEAAEYGIAAYWAYEEVGKEIKAGKKIRPKNFEWVKQLADWQKEFKKEKQSPTEFLESLKLDLFKDRIFVLTPKGDVIDLPEGATSVDFAYHIHSEIGHRMTGAKANGKMISFSRPLSSGDIVEILTGRNQKPSLEWLNHAKTQLAKGHIRSALRKQGVFR